ncbi:MAG: hypothetical protein J0L92_17760 [Deltaproteobacteria bacterium]|nr:hypothetical protein [Deltaproteobacteria bacterium]
MSTRGSSPSRGGVASLLAIGALLSGGCSLLFEPPVTQISNRCDVDDDCTTSSVCDATAHLCVSATAPDYRVRVQITPMTDPIDGVPVPMIFDLGQLADPPTPMELVAPVQVPVRGTARFDGTPIAAQITFARRVVEGEGPLRGALTGSVVVRASAATGGMLDFETQLPGGSTYDVYVEPQSEFRALLPPLSATLEVPEGAGVSFAIEYREEELIEVHGVVLDASAVPQEGLLVRLVDAYGRTLSSSASTDAVGHFTLVAPRGLTNYSFRVRGDTTRQDSSALLPSITLDATALLPGPDGTFTLLVPRSDRALRFEGRVELPATLGMNAPAPRAQLHLYSAYVMDPDTGLVGSLELDLTADLEGRFVGYVLPGDYQVAVVPADESVGLLVQDLEVLENPSSTLSGQLYTLPARSILGGTVRLVDGEPINGGRIRATGLGTALAGDPMPAARLNRSAMGATGAMGEFRLPLDVGVYDLVVEMPADSGYAWHVVHDFGVGGSSAALRREMLVSAPYRVTGTARFAEGTELAGARVRVFAVEETSGRSIEIASTTCDTRGGFVALLPSTLDDGAD